MAQQSFNTEDMRDVVGHLVSQQKRILDQMQDLFDSLAMQEVSKTSGSRMMKILPVEGDAMSPIDWIGEPPEDHSARNTQVSNSKATSEVGIHVTTDQTDVYNVDTLDKLRDPNDVVIQTRQENKKSGLRQLSSLENYVWQEHHIKRVLRNPPFFKVRKEPPRTGCLAGFVLSDKFEIVVGVVVSLYVVFTIAITNWLLKHAVPASQLPVEVQVADYFFEGIYVLEVLLRLMVHRHFYFLNDDKWWNMFDFAMVFIGLGSQLVSGFNTSLSPMFLRFLRTAKIARKVFRMLKLTRFVTDLRLITQAFVGSLLSLMWCIFFLAGFTLAYAVFFCQQFAVFIVDGGKHLAPKDKTDILKNFGSVQLGGETLLKSISGGVDWGDVHQIIAHLGGLSEVVFLSYILIVWLSLCNIITSLFLEKAMRLAQPEVNARALEHFKDNLASARELGELFRKMSGGSETVTPEHLTMCLADVKTASLFATHEIDICDVDTFLELIKDGHEAQIHVRTFVRGCMSLKGTARSIDLLAVKHKLYVLEGLLRQFVATSANCCNKESAMQ